MANYLEPWTKLPESPFLTHGRVTSDGVAPHDDYLTEFPFLGLPNAEASGGPATFDAFDTTT